MDVTIKKIYVFIVGYILSAMYLPYKDYWMAYGFVVVLNLVLGLYKAYRIKEKFSVKKFGLWANDIALTIISFWAAINMSPIFKDIPLLAEESIPKLIVSVMAVKSFLSILENAGRVGWKGSSYIMKYIETRSSITYKDVKDENK